MTPSPFRPVAAGFSFLEGPRWHDGRLWLSDFYTHQVFTVGDDGRTQVIATVPQQPSGLGWLPDGRLLICSMRDRRVMRLEPDGRLVVHADLSHIAGGHVNDMVVDAQGRAYVGNFGLDMRSDAPMTLARLALVQPDGQASVAAEGLYFPNGSMVTPDGRTLIVCETFGNRISAFDIQPGGGLGPRRDWAVFAPVPPAAAVRGATAALVVAPDGAVLDAEGAVWFADALGCRVVRVAEGGRILQELPTGPMGAFACTLGGPGRRTLYVCVAPDSMEHKRTPAREAVLWATDVAVPGAGCP